MPLTTPFSPPSGPATGSFNGLHRESNFLASPTKILDPATLPGILSASNLSLFHRHTDYPKFRSTSFGPRLRALLWISHARQPRKAIY